MNKHKKDALNKVYKVSFLCLFFIDNAKAQVYTVCVRMPY